MRREWYLWGFNEHIKKKNTLYDKVQRTCFPNFFGIYAGGMLSLDINIYIYVCNVFLTSGTGNTSLF